MDIVKLENYINAEEISTPRTPNEYILWFEEKLKITKTLREELQTQNILHQGIAKVFYEELFPLYRLLQNKLKEWEGVRFAPIIGNQNYDVEVKTTSNSIPRYIEIVIADMNEKEHARMEYFLNKGHVSMIGGVSIKRDKRHGKIIQVNEEVRTSQEVNLEVGNRIKELINKKIKVGARPNGTALLVFFDDYTSFRYDAVKSKLEMDAFLELLDIQWQNRYLALYVIGASGSFYERKN